MNACFEFDRLDPSNSARAVFAVKYGLHKKMVSRLRLLMEHGNPSDCPVICVRIRHEINDTAVPGLDFDYKKLELSCEWKGMYSALFREERELARRRQTVLSEDKDELSLIKEEVDREGVDAMELMQHIFGPSTGERPRLRYRRLCAKNVSARR